MWIYKHLNVGILHSTLLISCKETWNHSCKNSNSQVMFSKLKVHSKLSKRILNAHTVNLQMPKRGCFVFNIVDFMQSKANKWQIFYFNGRACLQNCKCLLKIWKHFLMLAMWICTHPNAGALHKEMRKSQFLLEVMPSKLQVHCENFKVNLNTHNANLQTRKHLCFVFSIIDFALIIAKLQRSKHSSRLQLLLAHPIAMFSANLAKK